MSMRRALIIGVGQDLKGSPSPYGPALVQPQCGIADAREVARLLHSMGDFEVSLSLNGLAADPATGELKDPGQLPGKKGVTLPSELLREAIQNLFASAEGSDGSVELALLFFSGNGGGVGGAPVDQGALLFPGYGCESSTHPSGSSTYLSLNDLAEWVADSPVPHRVVWLDSDFAKGLCSLIQKHLPLTVNQNGLAIFTAKQDAGGYALENGRHGVFTEALLSCLNPIKQQRAIVTTASLAASMVAENDWPQDCIDLNGPDIPLTEAAVRGQRFSNDLPEGEDRLGVGWEADALADLLLLKDLQPPLVMGILGGWGSGKSMLMHLMRQRMQRIRCMESSGMDYPYVGHVYLINFDAWAYAEGDIWISLMHTIFRELKEQFDMEQQIQAFLKDLDNEIQLSEEQRQSLESSFLAVMYRQGSIERKKRLTNVLSQAPKSLVDKMQVNELKEQFRVSTTHADVQQRQGKLERLLWECSMDIRTQDKVELEKLHQSLQDIRTQQESLRYLLQLLERDGVYGLLKHWRKAPGSVRDDVGRLTIAIWRRWGLTLVLSVVLLLLAWFLPMIPLMMPISNKGVRLILAVTGAMLSAIPIVKSSWKIATAIGQSGNKYATKVSSVFQADLQKELLRLQSAEQKQTKDIGKLDQISLLQGPATFLGDRSQHYRAKLGPLHRVQQDLKRLSDQLLFDGDASDPETREGDQNIRLFPRGKPRVVLFIDDLDRCPPAKVVQVLEAVQLLVRTELFISVLAIDERYVTRALEKEYAGILEPGGQPSGMDYLEKIIQIPYHVRPVSLSALPRYLESQMELKLEQTDTQNLRSNSVGSPAQGLPEKHDAVRDDGHQNSFIQAQSQPGPLAGSNKIPITTLRFSREELGTLKECCQRVALTPRSIKRLVNVLKIYKISEYHANRINRSQPDQTRIILSLLALSARYPEEIRLLFDRMELYYETLENLPEQQASSAQANGQIGEEAISLAPVALLDLLPETDTRPQSSSRSGELERRRLRLDAHALLQGKTIRDLDPELFNLVRSFCFFGDVGEKSRQ